MAVCFDGDGTLYRSQTTAAELWRGFCAERGVVVSSDEASAALARVSAQFDPRWSRLRDLKLASPHESARIEEAFWADHNAEMLASWGLERYSGEVRGWFNQADLESVALYEDTVPALRALADTRIAMGVYSNRPTLVQPAITRLGLARYFLWAGSAGETGFAKPDPRAFRTAAAALGVAPEALVYVGDSVVADVEGAWRSGCRPVLLDRSGRHHGATEYPVIGSLLDLPGRLGLWGDESNAGGPGKDAPRADG